MTNYIHDWIAKREQLERVLSTHESLVNMSGDLMATTAVSRLRVSDLLFEAKVDARRSLPVALAALKAVMEQEGPRAIGQYDDWSKGYHDALDACREAIEAALRSVS